MWVAGEGGWGALELVGRLEGIIPSGNRGSEQWHGSAGHSALHVCRVHGAKYKHIQLCTVHAVLKSSKSVWDLQNVTINWTIKLLSLLIYLFIYFKSSERKLIQSCKIWNITAQVTAHSYVPLFWTNKAPKPLLTFKLQNWHFKSSWWTGEQQPNSFGKPFDLYCHSDT